MIAIITYDKPHRKTQDLLYKLILNGYSNIHLVSIPFIERKKFLPIFTHRPSKVVDVSMEDLKERLNVELCKIRGGEELDTFFNENIFEYIFVGGAEILPDSLVKNHKIINAHPGYLPNVKGLDALKWSIYDGQPIGVTTHFLSEQIDEGKLIERKIVPIYFEDTFHSVAYRVYEMEIDMLVNTIPIIGKKNNNFMKLTDSQYIAKKRMPHHLEIIMMNRFEQIRENSRSIREDVR